MKRILTVLLQSFSGKYAFWGNTISGAGLFLAGDLIEQKLEKVKEIDKPRAARMTFIGLVMGPPHWYFYKYLDHFLPGKTLKTVSKKILADQLIACPVFSYQFFIGMALLEGKSWKESWQEFVDKFPTVYLVDWCLWPPIQFINFYLVPSKWRVLYVNSATVGWNVFLSYMKNSYETVQK